MSLFMGKLGSIDQSLIDSGKLKWIKNSAEIQDIKIGRKNDLESGFQPGDQGIVMEIVDKILAA